MTGDPTHRRLVLQLGHLDPAALHAAAEFAHLLGLDLHGLFIEDAALLDLAGFDFVREITLPTHAWRSLEPGRIEADLRHAAETARRQLDQAVRGFGVANVFEVRRGDPMLCLGQVCSASDIMVLAEPAAGRPAGLTRLHEVAQESAAAVLLLPARPPHRHGPVAALLAEATDPALDLAVRVARAAQERLLVLLPPGDTGAIRTRLAMLGVPPERAALREVSSLQAEDVAGALGSIQERLVVLTRGASGCGNVAGASALAAVRGVPVLLAEADRPV